MKHASMDHGFIMCWLLNMLFHLEWGLVALIMWALHCWFDISWYPAAAVLVCWVLLGFGITWFLSWTIGAGNKPEPQLKNVNPYSQANAKRLTPKEAWEERHGYEEPYEE